MNVTELVEVLEGLDVPLFAKVDIFEREEGDELFVKFCRAPREAPTDTIVITNDPTFPGEQLWPRP